MTRRFLKLLVFAFSGFLATRGLLRAEATNAAPDFREVYQLLRDNLPAATDETLNRAAVEGMLAQFPGKVSLISPGGALGGDSIKKSGILESNVAYLRVGDVSENLADRLAASYHALTATNKVAGVVLDLRFANGDAFTLAPALAKAIKVNFNPLAVLINGETRGAAEMLAAALRDAKAGLLIGSATAGEPATFKEFPLSNGERLRIATSSLKSGGPQTARVQPDVAVTVSADDELAYYADAYADLMKPIETSEAKQTNNFLTFIDRTSEADLVRSRRNGGRTNMDESPAQSNEPPIPVIHDPALARAVDFIKALGVVHLSHF